MQNTKAQQKYKIIHSNFLNPLNDKKCELLINYAVVAKEVKGDYVIKHFCPSSDIDAVFKAKKGEIVEVFELDDKILTPGFYDMHFHWVQDEVRQMPKDNLLEWLENYTWPYESKFKNKTFAAKKAKHFSYELAKSGTIGGACYGSIHEHSVDEALANFHGDFIVGNVLMTLNSPDYLLQDPKEARELTNKLSKKYKNKYAMTPRFAITTDPETMTLGAKYAKKNNSFIQTHLSETTNEIEFVLSIYKNMEGFKDIKTYTDIYDRCDLLSAKTIMGHGIHLSDKELKRLSQTQTTIAHCPTSNAPHKELGLGSGLFDYKKADKLKVSWALASDIGGGPFLSMLDVMNSFVFQNKKRGHADANFSQALFRSTLMGAKVLGLDSKAGNFAEGKFLNFVCIGQAPKNLSKLNSEEVLRKLVSRKHKDRALFENQIELTCFRGNFI